MADEPKPYRWIGLSGAIPEIEALHKVGRRELGTRLVVARLAARILEAGSGIVYGSHPTFVPLVEAAVGAVPQLDVTTKMVQMFIARRFLPTETDEHDFIQTHGLYAEVRCTGERSQERNPALTEMREQMINACDALICVGGKLHKDGAPPGVDAEAALALQHGKPVYLIGAGGGRALQIFQEQFSEDSTALHNGLTHEENRLLAETLDPWQATAMVLKGLHNRNLLRRIPAADMHTQSVDGQESLPPPARSASPPLPPSGEVGTNTLEHLKMIQGVINRLAGNSFSIKGWSLTLAAAILIFVAGKDSRISTILFALVAAIPVVLFWRLDAYYLNLERRFHRLYTAVLQDAQQPQGQQTITPFSMDLQPIAGEAESVWRTAWRRAVCGFHLPLLLAVLLSCGALWWIHTSQTPVPAASGGQPSISAPPASANPPPQLTNP